MAGAIGLTIADPTPPGPTGLDAAPATYAAVDGFGQRAPDPTPGPGPTDLTPLPGATASPAPRVAASSSVSAGPPPTPSSPSLTAALDVDTFDSGINVAITVVNRGPSPADWRVHLTLSPKAAVDPEAISNGVLVSRAGDDIVLGPGSALLQPGKTVKIRFTATWDRGRHRIEQCSIAGVACTSS
ncbi:hypothetical protein [Catellatospora sp. NPDC049609]|uniref:hypothetical protein n=1 Tax=Catellatospora sp. NPDC049609 TaxID=3155505 RepID=UPI00343FCBCE